MKQLGESTWIQEGPTNIGFIVTGNSTVLVDSGNDKESGRKLNKLLKEREWILKAVLNTHSNADHIGGNDYLQRNLGCEIWTPEVERSFTEHPELEAAFLWGGYAPKDLRNKFFRAKPSSVTRAIKEGDEIEGAGRIISLPGHFFNMAGVHTPDGVLFLGDCLFGEEILEKYGIPFIYDVESYMGTINRIRDMEARWYVPSHGPVVSDIAPLADKNLHFVEKIESRLLELLSEESGFERILKGVCDSFDIKLNAGQYALAGSTVRSFLTWLQDRGLADYSFKENRMLWSRGEQSPPV